MGDHLSAAYSECTNFIMQIGGRCNCRDEVNRESVTHLFCQLDSRYTRRRPTFFPGKLTFFWKFFFFSFFFFLHRSRAGHITFASRLPVMTRAARKDMQMNRLTITIDHCQEKRMKSSAVLIDRRMLYLRWQWRRLRPKFDETRRRRVLTRRPLRRHSK